jgi:RNA polymerase sigma factor (sigma-70 family)
MVTIVKIINRIMEGDIDSYNLFKNKVASYIDSHYPNISHNEYEDIFENIIEKIIENNERLKLKNNPYQYVHRLINSNIKKYSKDLENESNEITELNEDIYYSEDLIVDQICKTELIAQIYNVLNTLTERQRKVIKYRFYESSTLEETGQRFGVSRTEIGRLEAKALRKLRHPTISKKIVDFLDLDPDDDINNICGQSISREYCIDYLGFNVNDKYNYYLDKLNSGLKVEEEIPTKIQEEIESNRKEMERKEKLKNENTEEKKKKENEERKKKAEDYINYLKEKEEYERSLNHMYEDIIIKYNKNLNEIHELIHEILLKTKGHRKELYAIILNYSGICFDKFKNDLVEFLNKYKEE